MVPHPSDATPDPSPTVHRPGPGGILGSAALCGATFSAGVNLVMHEWDYNCPECGALSGEKGGAS